MNSIIFITLALSTFQSSFLSDQDWMLYKEKHEKNYRNKFEEIRHYNIYKQKDEMIRNHNEKYWRNEVTYLMGHNQFSDMSDEELNEIFLRKNSFDEQFFDVSEANLTIPQAPDTLSYKDYCLPPLDQGMRKKFKTKKLKQHKMIK